MTGLMFDNERGEPARDAIASRVQVIQSSSLIGST
jgi:hypothetical protein